MQQPASASLTGWRKAMMVLLLVASGPALVAWWAGMAWALVAVARYFHHHG